MKLLNSLLKKLHVDSLAVPTERYFSNQDSLWSGTTQNLQTYLVSLLFIRATHTLHRHDTTSPPNQQQFCPVCVCSTPRESASGVLCRPPVCWFFLWQLQFIQTWLTLILDLWYLGTCNLLQEVFVSYFLFVFSVLYTKMHWRVHSLADTFGHLTVFLWLE
jgi:hypothetical protein